MDESGSQTYPCVYEDWKTYLNNFLSMAGWEVPSGAGHISTQQVKEHAYEQYELYDKNRKKIKANEVDLLIEETEQILIIDFYKVFKIDAKIPLLLLHEIAFPLFCMSKTISVC